MKRTKSKRKYVVGYAGDRQVVYGPDSTIAVTSPARWADRMTLRDARRRLKHLSGTGSVRIVYRLVPAETYGPGEMPPKETRKRGKAKK